MPIGYTNFLVPHFVFSCILDCKLNEMCELNGVIGALKWMVGMFLRNFATVELGLKVKLFNILCLSLYEQNFPSKYEFLNFEHQSSRARSWANLLVCQLYFKKIKQVPIMYQHFSSMKKIHSRRDIKTDSTFVRSSLKFLKK